ncbi:MAG TPA: hypothetical protein VFG51_00955 [Candidatus Saccharimonadia bacterium]|nr:hypothetical protein [Candidatus Saccharimonadia bacterium]
MEHTLTSFEGQQTDERILYVIRPHDIVLYSQLAKIYALALAVMISFFLLISIFPALPTIGMFIAVALAGIGTIVVFSMFSKNIAYVTDRRVIRFEPATPFASNVRSINWDDAAKVKTFAPNFLWKMVKVGTVIIHSSSSVIHLHENVRENTVSNDDLDLENVFYYRDLGNYIDKIIYTARHQPGELKDIHPFVPKPKGQRY